MSTKLFGGKLPVMLTFDVDGETNWISRNPGSIDLPVCLSNGAYGPKVGLKRILDILDVYKIKATFFVPGWTIERYQPEMYEIVLRGHEMAHHMYKHEYPFKINDEEKERELINKATEIIQELSGEPVAGFRAPGEFSPFTLKLIQELGFRYSSNSINLETPYMHPSYGEGTPLVEIPWPSANCIDSPYFSCDPRHMPGRMIHHSDDFYENLQWQFDGLAKEEDRVFMLIAHPQYVGRASRVRSLVKFIEHCLTNERTWFARCDEVAEAFRLSTSP